MDFSQARLMDFKFICTYTNNNFRYTNKNTLNSPALSNFRNQHYNCSNYSNNNYGLLCFKADMLFFSEYYKAHILNTRSNNNKQNSILSPKPTKYKTSPRQSVSKQFQRSLK